MSLEQKRIGQKSEEQKSKQIIIAKIDNDIFPQDIITWSLFSTLNNIIQRKNLAI